MFTRILPTTLLQIFCENLLYFQVIFKSMKIADDTLLATLSVNGLISIVKCLVEHYIVLVYVLCSSFGSEATHEEETHGGRHGENHDDTGESGDGLTTSDHSCGLVACLRGSKNWNEKQEGMKILSTHSRRSMRR